MEERFNLHVWVWVESLWIKYALSEFYQVFGWMFIYPECNPFPWNLTKFLCPGKWSDLDFIQQKQMCTVKQGECSMAAFQNLIHIAINIKKSFLYFLWRETWRRREEEKERRAEPKRSLLGSYQAFRLDCFSLGSSRWLPSRAIANGLVRMSL